MTSPALISDPPAAATGRPAGPGTPGSARLLLRAALRTRRRDLVAAAALYSTHQLGESLVPVIVGATVSGAVDHGSWAAIGTGLAALAADFVFLSMSYRFGARASMRAKQHTGHQVRMWLADRVVGPAGGVDNPPGDLLSRASGDADRVGGYAGMFAITVAAGVVLAASTVLLLRFSLLLGAVIVAGTAVLLAARRAVAAALRTRSGEEQARRADATALAEDLVRGLRVLKGIGAQDNAAAAYRRVSRQANASALRAASAQAALTAVGSLLTGLYLAAIAGTGGWLALRGRLDLGELVAALGLARFVIGPMQVLSGAGAARARALASAERIRQVLAAGPAVASVPAGRPVQPARGEIEFAGVALGPGHAGDGSGAGGGDGSDAREGDGAAPVLTARIPAGVMAGIVCGDPVVAARVPALLAREQDPPSGTLLLDGEPLPALPLAALREHVVVGHHDAVLFPGSVAENLAAVSAGPAATARATAAAFADEVVAALPAGAAAPVGDRGERLSGGQRQRVALARVLAAEAAVLVLHDPTTAVDAVTEDRIAGRVREARSGRTTLLVTTGPAWLSRCDLVLFLAPGGLLSGTHASLLAHPDYRRTVTR